MSKNMIIEIIKNKNLRINENRTVDLLPNSQLSINLISLISGFIFIENPIEKFDVLCEDANVVGDDIVDFSLK